MKSQPVLWRILGYIAEEPGKVPSVHVVHFRLRRLLRAKLAHELSGSPQESRAIEMGCVVVACQDISLAIAVPAIEVVKGAQCLGNMLILVGPNDFQQLGPLRSLTLTDVDALTHELIGNVKVGTTAKHPDEKDHAQIGLQQSHSRRELVRGRRLIVRRKRLQNACEVEV